MGTAACYNPQLVAGVAGGRNVLRVKLNGQPKHPREFVVLNGFTPSHTLGVYDNDVNAVVCALTERYFNCSDGLGGFHKPLRVGKRAFKQPGLVHFKRLVMDAMPYVPRLTPPQVVSLYVGGKQKVYSAAMRSLEVLHLHPGDSRLGSFVKFEKQDTTKAPRIINPRTARYNLCLARYLKHAEKLYFKAINVAFGSRTPATVIKGYNADQSARIIRQKWDLFEQPVCVGLDATKFDMHVSVRALEYEHSFYKSLFPGDELLKKLLSWQLVNSGVARLPDGKVEFAVEGTRSSGDINTSLGNCLLMCAMVHAYASFVGVDVELANNGDDCVVFMEQKDEANFIAKLDAWFALRGFRMQTEPSVYEFEGVEFCQSKPILVGAEWRMVRNLVACLRKDAMCLVPVPNHNTYRKWLFAVGECGLALCAGVPVLEAYYRRFYDLGVQCSDGFRREVFKNRSQLQLSQGVRKCAIDARSRVSFYYAFGVTPDAHIQMEEALSSRVLQPLDNSKLVRDDLRHIPGLNIVDHLY